MWPFRLWGFDSPFSHPFQIPFILWIVFFFVGTGLWGCASPPEDTVKAAFEATDEEDFETFCSQFTQESCDLLRALKSGPESQSQFTFPAKRGSISIESAEVRPLATFRRTGSNTLEAVDLALVSVKSEEDQWKIPLVKERGRWKINLFLGIEKNDEKTGMY